MAENACKGPENGPVRAPKEKNGTGTAPTLNRSTWSEAKAPSGARPGRVFDDEGGKYGTDARARKKVLASSSEREGGKTKFKGFKAAGVLEGAAPLVR